MVYEIVSVPLKFEFGVYVAVPPLTLMLPLDALPIVIEMDADPRYESLASKLIEAELSSSSDMETAIA